MEGPIVVVGECWRAGCFCVDWPYNIMENNWEYRPYHLIYAHSCGSLVYLGDLAAATNLNFLHSQRITTVVTAALGMDQLDYSQMQITHILYPLLDAKRPTAANTFANFYEILEKQIKEGNVLVHCSSGVSRSPTLLISYLMKKENWTFKEAVEFVRSKGRKVLPTLGFERQLKAYEGVLRHSDPIAVTEKRQPRGGSDWRRRSSKMRFVQSQLPNLSVFPLPLHSTSFTISPSPTSNMFATLVSRRDAATQQLRRQRLVSSELRTDTMTAKKVKRSSLALCQSSQTNNFEVRRVLINQRACRPHNRPKSLLLSP